jgi:Na+-transporting NADH:ubiquinone oxidoreductase subunit A
LKRRLLDIVIELAPQEAVYDHGVVNIAQASRDEIVQKLLQGGAFARIRSRPCNRLANPHQIPKAIFVKALESAPLVPPSEYQVQGREEDFQYGLSALSHLAKVHLIYRQGSPCKAFSEAKEVTLHTAEGPHPIANVSLHIYQIDPLLSSKEVVWTVNADDVVAIGTLLRTGIYDAQRIISIAGEGILATKRGFFRAREGHAVKELVAERLETGPLRLISGDPLNGEKVELEGFLGANHYALTVLRENTQREFLHFLRAGSSKFSATRTYLSGHQKNREHSLTTHQHGEERPFIDSAIYDKVMPMQIPTIPLVKALLAEDFETAEELGLLEIDSEDFALATFICPSKIEIAEIVRQGLHKYAEEMLCS